MRLIETPNNESAKADAYWETLSAALPAQQQVYNEMSDVHVTDVDVLAQLRANVEALADLQSRLSFVMREVKYLLKA